MLPLPAAYACTHPRAHPRTPCACTCTQCRVGCAKPAAFGVMLVMIACGSLVLIPSVLWAAGGFPAAPAP